MASPKAPTEPAEPAKPERNGTSPVLIVAGTVAVVFLVTFLIYKVGGYEDEEDVYAGPGGKLATPTSGECGTGSPDDTYNVAVATDPDPPSPEGTTVRLTVRRARAPVTGAKVCVIANMPDMEHPGLNTVAKELPGGRYETALKFGMGGSWKASVVIAEPGKPVASVSVSLEVAPVILD